MRLDRRLFENIGTIKFSNFIFSGQNVYLIILVSKQIQMRVYFHKIHQPYLN